MAERLQREYGQSVMEVFLEIVENPEYTTAQISQATGQSTRSVERHISKLKKLQIIERVGPNLGGKWIIK